jgi:carboxymethylenebutenolidase
MKRTAVMLLLGIFASFSVFAEMGVVTEEVSYFQGNSKVKGYLAKPVANGSYPALILIHEWWGLNENIKDFSRKFAELGYVALAVDLYNGEMASTADEAKNLAGAVRQNVEGAFVNLNQAVAFLKNRSDSVDPERLAAVGWCFGGGWSYLMAKNNLGVKASIMYYGQFNPKDDLAMMRATILGHFGEKDMGIKVDTVREFQASLRTHNGNHEVYIYPNAGHAFANDGGPNYDKAAADLAWMRTREFLNRYL